MNQKIIELANSLIKEEWLMQTKIEWIHLFRQSKAEKSKPLLYNPSIIFIFNWYKKLYLEDNVYEYWKLKYLLVSAPTPVMCETFMENDTPFLWLSIQIDLNELYNLVRTFELNWENGNKTRGLSNSNKWILPLPLNEKIENCLIRLLEVCMLDLDSQVLWTSIRNEILFHTIKNEDAKEFCNLVLNSKNFTEFGNILKKIHIEYDSNFDIETLAKQMHMSIPTFHRNFKSMTGYSPIQYIKNIRLNKAKVLLDVEWYSVKEAAQNVWYTSQSQFSREYKRYFGNPPISDSKK